jgi:hypothetical protein
VEMGGIEPPCMMRHISESTKVSLSFVFK